MTTKADPPGIRRQEALTLLRDNIERLRDFGITSIALFGSVARDDARPDSDIDILVDFNEPKTFDNYIDAKLFLEELFGRPVDLVMRGAIRPRARLHIEKQLVAVA